MTGAYFMSELLKLKDECDIIGDVRGKGLMIGIDMVKDKVAFKLIVNQSCCKDIW